MKTKNNYPWALIITLLFVILKLCHVIEWQWVWVLSPFWLPISLLFVLLLFIHLLD